MTKQLKNQSKLAFLDAIRERKTVLFSSFNTINNEEKIYAWKSVHVIVHQSLRLASSDQLLDQKQAVWVIEVSNFRLNKYLYLICFVSSYV